MLSEPLSKRYRDDGRENFDLTLSQIAARDRIAAKLHGGNYQVEEVECPLCGCMDRTCLSEKDTYGLPVRVVACIKCGLVYNSPRLTPGCLPAFYSEDYRELDRVLPSIDAYFQLESVKGQRIYRFLESGGFLSVLEGKLIVDIGCGAGGVLGYFKQAGYRVLGCDLVPAHLEYGKNEKRLDLHYGSLREVQQIVSETRADVGLVIYEQVFEHLPDPSAELKMLHDLMGPDSLLFIGVPGLRNIDEQYGSDFLRFLQLPHLVHFDLEHLVALLESNRFEFMAGNEIAQAVFKKSNRDVPGSIPSFDSTANFLTGLERRRKRQAVASWVLHLPRNLARRTRKAIENSPLPAPLRNRVIQVLQRIKRLVQF